MSADRAQMIFGNPVSDRDYKSACSGAAKNKRLFGDDSQKPYLLCAEPAPVIGSRLGVRWLKLAPKSASASVNLEADSHNGKPVVIGNIRMGFGHYRIAMAMASAAHSLGYDPYWFDLCAFEKSTCSKLVKMQNKLYSTGSKISQKVEPFNALVWEPLNSEGFKKLSYNASDQKNAELMAPVYKNLPKDVPFIGTHAWTAQAAIAAGLTNVVNAIPDNWPMALHLAEGSLHTVQTPNACLGYRLLRGMDGDNKLKPMPKESIADVGHYIDHELVSNIEADCGARIARAQRKEPVRYLLCVGGAGAQRDMVEAIIKYLLPAVNDGEAVLLVNVGDHADVLKALEDSIPELCTATAHRNDFKEVEELCQRARNGESVTGIHTFCDQDIFGAVYSTNVLMRICDFLVTKPSELAFYPVPKMLIRRVGGHEAYNAFRAAELGEGTFELETESAVFGMIDLVQQDRSVIEDMCRHIVANKAAGIYDGAYNVVKLAVGESL